MSSPTVTTPPLDLDDLRARIDFFLTGFLRRSPASDPVTVPSGPSPAAASAPRRSAEPLSTALADFVLAPGKRIRPLLCVLGWYAGGGGTADRGLWHLAASLELFHAFALIHDDVMDASDTRRGLPTAHRSFAARHAFRRDAAAFGTNAAILLGDLALVRADELLHTAPFSARERRAVLPLVDAMRHDLVQGQYLDLLSTGAATDDIEHALTVNRLKTAQYTVERPLQLGAALAGAGPGVLRACSSYALPLGGAFQLRDDLLGAFGDPLLTGKSACEDLRSGKATVLMALAARRADPAQLEQLTRLVGDPGLDENGADRVRRVLERTGAREAVEAMIAERYADALRALDRSGFPPPVTAALRHVAATAVHRTA